MDEFKKLTPRTIYLSLERIEVRHYNEYATQAALRGLKIPLIKTFDLARGSNKVSRSTNIDKRKLEKMAMDSFVRLKQKALEKRVRTTD